MEIFAGRINILLVFARWKRILLALCTECLSHVFEYTFSLLLEDVCLQFVWLLLHFWEIWSQWHSSKLSFQSRCCCPLQERHRVCLFVCMFHCSNVFTAFWRKLRAKVGHAWDKCCYICQRNQTTKTCRDNCPSRPLLTVSVWPHNCLPATDFVNNAEASVRDLVLNLFCSRSRLAWREK